MKCVITVAGLGTRLLPLTKSIPKEMLPIYEKTSNGNIVLKPIIQIIFESLYKFKISNFCFIVNKNKKSVQQHFTPETNIIEVLTNQDKKNILKNMKKFYAILNKSDIHFTNQSKPIGFGDAIQKGEKFVNNEIFLLHAGDDIVISKNNDHLKRLKYFFKKYNADIAFLIEKVDDPRKYGVVNGDFLEKGVLEIKEMEEKPKKPKSKFAVIAIYIFKPIIFEYLSKAKKYADPEKQLAEAFNIAIKNNNKIIGITLKKSEKRIDIGTPELYSKVLVSLK